MYRKSISNEKRWKFGDDCISLCINSALAVSNNQILHLHFLYSFYFCRCRLYTDFTFSILFGGLYSFLMSKNQKKLTDFWKKQTYLYFKIWFGSSMLFFSLAYSNPTKLLFVGLFCYTCHFFKQVTCTILIYYASISTISTYFLYHNYIFAQRSSKNKNYTILQFFSSLNFNCYVYYRDCFYAF